MPPKNRQQQEDPGALSIKARDHLDSHRYGEAEAILDKADDKGLSKDIRIMAVRAYWCLRTFRFEEATHLSISCVDELCKRIDASPKTPVDNETLNLSTWILQNIASPEACKKLQVMYEKVLPQYSALGGTNDKAVLENYVSVSAYCGDFKQMQKFCQELNKKSYKESKYTIWMVFAFLMQIQNRKNLTPEEAGSSLHYKLALRTLETYVSSQVALKEKQIAAAKKKSSAAAASSGKKKNNNKSETEKNKSPDDEQNLNAPAITPAVCNLFVDVLVSQQKYEEAIDFLLNDTKGKFFGSRSERIREVGVVLRKSGGNRNAEANAIARHLLWNFENDRWDFFEDYRDTTLELIAKNEAAASYTKKDSSDAKKILIETEAGKNTLQDLIDDLLALNKQILSKGGKSRAPRLGVISLLSDETVSKSINNRKELRASLIQEHVAQVGLSKSVLFFDLVKYVSEKDAEAIFDKIEGAFVFSAYCRRHQLAKSDEETTDFVNKCLAKISIPKESSEQEDSAVKSDIYIVAAISACIRRHLAVCASSSSSSNWLLKATSIAARAVKLYGINSPHITFLSTILHRKIGSSDLDSIRALDIKSIQHETIVAALQIAIEENHTKLICDLTDSASTRFYKSLHRDCDQLIDKGLKTMSFLAFEEVFATKEKFLNSCSRVESVAIDALLNNVYTADTSSELKTKLLTQRADLMEIVLSASPESLISLEDRVHLLAVCLHEEPRSEEFTKTVDFLLPQSTHTDEIKKRASLAQTIAAALVTLEIISGESTSSKYQNANRLPSCNYEEKLKMIESVLASSSSFTSATPEFLQQHLFSLAKDVFNPQNQKPPQKQQAISGIEKLLDSCCEYIKCSSSSSSSSFFFFPFIQLIVLAVRVTCERQAQGVKGFITKLKNTIEEEVLSKLVADQEKQKQQNDDQSAKNPIITPEMMNLDSCQSTLEKEMVKSEGKKLTRRIEIVSEAIKMIGVMEKMTK